MNSLDTNKMLDTTQIIYSQNEPLNKQKCLANESISKRIEGRRADEICTQNEISTWLVT